jgi:hypothetical protein
MFYENEDNMAQFHLSQRSRNSKTGPIPVSTTSADTCPDACPLKAGGGCYAESNFHLRLHWQKVSAGKSGIDYSGFLAKIAKLPAGQLWRHNQAGDLPGEGDSINTTELDLLVVANHGKRGFTYTHKPMDREENRAAVRAANAHGFTINLSGNNPKHADELASLAIAPVVVMLPSTVQGNVKIETPAGRRVVVCPATYRDNVTCASCGLCQRQRDVIVGFPAHGAGAHSADIVAKGE